MTSPIMEGKEQLGVLRVAKEEVDSGCAFNRDKPPSSDTNACTALVPYGGRSCPQLSWEADSTWSLRMLRVLIECARLKMLMAWWSTLGGAHSSLGEHNMSHAEVAGVISGQQLSLAVELRDPLMGVRCKLYLAYSLLQQGKLKQANKLIREQYRYLTKEATVKDVKLLTMCLAAWERLAHLRQHKRLTYCQRTDSLHDNNS